jgi:hypothetical protein
MAMEGGGMEVEVFAKRIERFPVREKKADGADISVVRAVPDEGDAVFILVVCAKPALEKVED